MTGSSEGELVSDAGLEKLLQDRVTHDVGAGASVDLDADIASIERALERSAK